MLLVIIHLAADPTYLCCSGSSTSMFLVRYTAFPQGSSEVHVLFILVLLLHFGKTANYDRTRKTISYRFRFARFSL